jgi:hypothetical protein
MRPKWLVALAVVLAIVVCGSVVAGPRRPQESGDPDIYEGARPRDGAPRERLVADQTVVITIDIPFCHRLIYVTQERTLRLNTSLDRVSATSERAFRKR